MIVSHSKVETFESCPYRYDLRYNQGIKTIPPDNADNALFLGTALHTGLEKDVQTAIHEYFMSYPVISDGDKSVMMLSQVMTLTEEEMLCIRFHMGAYVTSEWDAFDRAIRKYQSVLFTHTADMYASKVKDV